MSIPTALISAISISTCGPWRTSGPVPSTRTVLLAGAARPPGRSRADADRGVVPCASLVAHTMTLANSGSTEEVLAVFFYGREDIIPEMFRRLSSTLHDAKTTTSMCVILSITSIATSNSMAIVTDPRAASCSKICSRARHIGPNGLCKLRAAVSKPGSAFGTAH